MPGILPITAQPQFCQHGIISMLVLEERGCCAGRVLLCAGFWEGFRRHLDLVSSVNRTEDGCSFAPIRMNPLGLPVTESV